MSDNTNYIGVAMGMDVSDLKAGISEANKQIQLANSEFKAASSGMENWAKSTDGLNAKIKQLDTVLSAQKSKLAGLQAEYDKVAKEQGENSEAARRLQIQINNQQSVVNRTEREFNNYRETLEKVEKGEIDLEETSLKAGKAVEKAGKQAEDAGDGFTIAKGAVAGFIANGLTALVGAAKDAVVSLFNLSEETREFRQDMATLETAFSEASFSAETATDTWRDLYAVFGEDDRAVEAANNIARMAENEKELNEWVQITTGVWGTYQDALPVESLAEAAGETAKVGTVTGTLADALNWSSDAAVMFADYMGGDVVTAEDAFNVALSECTTEAERQALITDTLTKLYGGAAKEYENTAASVMEANKQTADYSLTQAELGEKIEPVTTAIRGGFNGILASVVELAADGSMDDFAKKIENGFSWFIDTAIPKIKDGLKWIVDNKNAIIAGIVAMGTAFLAFKVVTLIQGVTTALKGMTAAQWLLNAAMSANPIGLVIAAISALVAAFVYLWNTCEPFKQFWIDLWEGIKNAFSTVVEWIKENWQTMLLFLVNPLAGVFKYCYEHFEGFRNFVDNIVSAVKNFFSDLWQNIKGGAQAAVDWVTSIFSIVANWFNENVIQPIWNFIYPFIHNAKVLITGTWEIIKALFSVAALWFDENVIQPIAKFFSGLWSSVSSWASNSWNKIKEIFQVVSSWFNTTVVQPVSKFFSGMWDKLKKGASDAWSGIKSVFSVVSSWFRDKFSEAWQAVKDVFSTGGKVFDGIKDGIVSAFKTVVNAIIRGINKVVSIPFNAINSILGKIKNVEVAGISPFSGLISDISVPEIPELEHGGILKRGQVGLLEGKGDEAIIPLERNLEWIKNIARELSEMLGIDALKSQLSAEIVGGVTSAGNGSKAVRGNTVIDARMTVNYNGNLSRKELKRLENDNYTAVKTKLKAEGAIG